MKIIDISQELFAAPVYPGDPAPVKEFVMSMEKEKPDICQVTRLTIGSHAGTHLDAPRHFVRGGKDTAELSPERCVGPCKVVTARGRITPELVHGWLADGTRRILVRGEIEITPEAAQAMADGGLLCIGVEGLTVGVPGESQVKVHQTLLGAEIVIIEGLRLDAAADGEYLLAAQPLKMKELDGSPVRALLLDDING